MHFIRQAKVRYHINLTMEDLVNIKKCISNRSAKLLQKANYLKRQNTIYLVLYQERNFRVVYDDLRNQLITVLPE